MVSGVPRGRECLHASRLARGNRRRRSQLPGWPDSRQQTNHPRVCTPPRESLALASSLTSQTENPPLRPCSLVRFAWPPPVTIAPRQVQWESRGRARRSGESSSVSGTVPPARAGPAGPNKRRAPLQLVPPGLSEDLEVGPQFLGGARHRPSAPPHRAEGDITVSPQGLRRVCQGTAYF